MAAELGEKEVAEDTAEDDEQTREDEDEDNLSTGKRAKHSKKHKHKHSKKHRHKHKKRKHKKISLSHSRSRSSSRSRSPYSNLEEQPCLSKPDGTNVIQIVNVDNGTDKQESEDKAKDLSEESEDSMVENTVLVNCEDSFSFKLTKSPSRSPSPSSSKEPEVKKCISKGTDCLYLENKSNLGFPLKIGLFSRSKSKSPVSDMKIDRQSGSKSKSPSLSRDTVTEITVRSRSHSKSRSKSPDFWGEKINRRLGSKSRSPSDSKIKKRSRSHSRSRSRSPLQSRKSRSKSPRKADSKKKSSCSRSKSRSNSRSRSHNKHRNANKSKSRSRSPRKHKQNGRSRSRSSSYSRKKSRKKRGSHSKSSRSRSRSPRKRAKTLYRSRGRSRSRSKSPSHRDRRSSYNTSPRRSQRDKYDSRSRRTRSRSPKRTYSRRSRSITPQRRSNRYRSRSRSPRRGRSKSPRREKYRRRSRSRSYSSHRRSRSRSRSKSRDNHQRRSRSKSNDKNNDEGNKSAAGGKGVVPAGIPMTNTEKPTAQDLVGKAPTVSDPSNKRSLAQLTEFCKKLAEARGIEAAGNEEENKEEEEDTLVEISHPFLVAPKRDITIPQVIFPVKMFPPLVSSDKPLTEQFPVSCGTKHHEKEQEYAAGEIIPYVDGTALQTHPVFQHPQSQEKLDISSLVVKRMDAQRRLHTDANDVEAMLSLQEVEMKLNNWCQSNVKPGQFTGQLAKTMMPKEKFHSGYQAWARKDMFHNLNPVSGGVGMKLLQKMGWEPGQVLGKRGDGMVEPIALTVKVDRRGLTSNTEKPVGKKGGNKAPVDLQGKHPISSLQEYCARRKWQVPDFTLIFDEGPPHSKQFLFKVAVNGYEYQHPVVSGNKKHAKAQAAVAALKGLALVPEDAEY